MPNLLKDLVSMVEAQAKRPLHPSTSNRFSPAKQNVASGPIADLTARIEDTNAKVTVEPQQEQAKIDAFVFMNMLRKYLDTVKQTSRPIATGTMEEKDEWDDALLSEIEAIETRHLQQYKDQNPSKSVTTTTLSSSWSCRSCTLENEATRATCLVCSTPRGRLYQISPIQATYSAKTKVQKTLFSDRREISGGGVGPLQLRQPNDKHPTTIEAESERIQTSRHLTSLSEAPMDAISILHVPRHAAGEDAQAKTRYLDVEMNSKFPSIDYEAAQHFVYPTNYSIRDYQLKIAEKALYHNTLVSLPTGLGKTLVAAVVMYNFYRWFPTGKVVFMAPTKPLVAQQIKACHEIMGISLSDTAELQGNVPPTVRRVLWNSKRVFFCTPQSLQNDLKRGVCAAEKFVCIVVDEAHRATGNYAYCCVVQEIETKTRFFRVLALSATPGASFDVIQDVVNNLRISHIESRSVDDSDVKKYTHARQEEVIVCRLGTKIMEMKELFLKCFTPIVQRLVRNNIIQHGDPDKLTSWYVLQARETFRKSPHYSSNRSAECDLALLVSLLHAKNLLVGHGLSSFRDQIVNWVEEREKGKMSWSKREMLLSSEFQAVESTLAVIPAGAESSIETASHPKLLKLREVLLEHFERHTRGQYSTRAIVFTQYRASVLEIVAQLRPLAPLLNVQPFVGQGISGKAKENKGQSQKVQQEIVRRFRSGQFNVLVATCIAEEGLDIGEVDLIVSFDALASPVRMIQRMGRTGRKRVGRVIILVTEGQEQRKLARSASAAKTVSRALTTFKSKFTYSQCPRMLPAGVCPQLRELAMNIPTFRASQVCGKTVAGAIDPSLWQLSGTERAQAVTNYFPSNYEASVRKEVYPVVANPTHLLRSQPRALMNRNVGAQVGYSSRSLILLALVRQIHNIEGELEADVDQMEKETDAVDVSGKADDGVCSPVTVFSERNGKNECDESFASTKTFDMHFSPPFVDLATQSVEDGAQANDATLVSSHQTSSASSSTSVSGSPHFQTTPCHQRSRELNERSSIRRDAVVSKLRSTRQLKFDEDESLDGDDSGEVKTKRVRIDENHNEEGPVGDLSVLLPLSDNKNKCKVHGVKLRERKCQLVDARTDDDEVEKISEVKSEVEDELECNTDTVSRSDAVGTEETTQKCLSPMDESSCAVCLECESYDDDPIVFCDGCNVPVHQFCYGINMVSSATWFCDSCVEAGRGDSRAKIVTPRDCELCPLRGGALKRTLCGKWVHVQCFLWIPELGVGSRKDELLVLGDLSSLDVDRRTLECSLCHSSKGNGIIQCAHERCLTAFHVSCAAFARYRMDVLDTQGKDSSNGTLFLAYCSLHRDLKASVKQQAVLSSPTGSVTTTETSSPSHLLTSPPSAEVKKKYRTFRRLKRKYEATQSQVLSPAGIQESNSPWQKSIRRSKRRREMSRVLAAAYIEDTVEVRGEKDDEEEEDEEDYGDSIEEAGDDSFINDSSQLLYSQSVLSQEQSDDLDSTKKRKKLNLDMRAIYARSLCESQSTSFLQRRRGRQFSALPSNGIIRSCLEAMDDDKFSSCCDESQTADDPLLMTPSASIATGNEADEAEASPSFSLLGAKIAFEPARVGPRSSEEQEEGNGAKTEDDELSAPSFNLLGVVHAFSGAASTSAKESKCLLEKSYQKDTKDAELHLKIEANRLKALKRLEERRQRKRQLDDVASLSMTLQRNESPQWIIYVSSTFAGSRPFLTFRSTKHSTCVVAVENSLEASALLSVRVAVYFLPEQELQDLARASLAQNVTTSRRLETLLAMHKRLVITIVHSGTELPGIQLLQQLENVTVIVQPTIDSLCEQLHEVAHQERTQGYELPSPRACSSDTTTGDLDASFTSRLQFFRTLSPLSLDSALSLSFRFKNFTAKQVPVRRFNVMHWRRMLPWISESTAQDIQTHLMQKVSHH